MNTKVLTSIIVSLSVAFTSASASVRMKHVYVPVLSPAQQAAAQATAETSAIAGQLQPILPSKNYGRVTGELKEYWDGKNLVKEAIEHLTTQEKAELCNDISLILNNTGFPSQIPLVLHSGGFLTPPTAFHFAGVSAECKSVLFNNFMYSLIKTGCYGDVPLLSKSAGYWSGSSIAPMIFSGVGLNFKAELYANVSCSLAKIGAYEEIKELAAKSLFWTRSAAPASWKGVSPAPKATLGAALSCSFIKSADYSNLMNLVMRSWGYFNGAAFVASAITPISEPYKSIVKNALEIGFTHTGRATQISALKKL